MPVKVKLSHRKMFIPTNMQHATVHSFKYCCNQGQTIALSVFIEINNSKLNIHVSCCRCFGPKCSGCGDGILPQDYVRKARDRVYHLKCFACTVCRKQLATGEVLYLGTEGAGDENALLCKEDYLKTHQGKDCNMCNRRNVAMANRMDSDQ